MAGNRNLRKRLIVDVQIQGALAVRVVIYWLLCLFSLGILLLLWRMLAVPFSPLDEQLRGLWSLYRPTAILSLILLPLIVVDVLRLSNRFAGPMIRMRRVMHELAQGKSVPVVKFRKGDFWQEFAQDFNIVAARLAKAQAASACEAAHHEDEDSVPVGVGSL
jgi:hypothetical protein